MTKMIFMPKLILLFINLKCTIYVRKILSKEPRHNDKIDIWIIKGEEN